MIPWWSRAANSAGESGAEEAAVAKIEIWTKDLQEKAGLVPTQDQVCGVTPKKQILTAVPCPIYISWFSSVKNAHPDVQCGNVTFPYTKTWNVTHYCSRISLHPGGLSPANSLVWFNGKKIFSSFFPLNPVDEMCISSEEGSEFACIHNSALLLEQMLWFEAKMSPLYSH